MQRLISSLIQNVIISSFLLCVGGLSQNTSDQENESIWKILAIENRLPDIGIGYYYTIAFEERLSIFGMISLLARHL